MKANEISWFLQVNNNDKSVGFLISLPAFSISKSLFSRYRKYILWVTTSSIERRRIIPVRNKQPVSFSLHR